MSLVPAKCPECGGNINIDSEKKAAICEFCKAPFVVEDAINNFNTTYNVTNHNDIKADVVNVYESKEKDFIIKAGVLEGYTGEADIIKIPDNVKAIKPGVFESMGIKKVIFNHNVSVCSSHLFVGCHDLEEVELSKQIKTIETYAFSGCTNLKNVIIPDGCLKIEDHVFENCTSLEKIIIPETVVEIGLEIFDGCNNLKTVEFKNDNIKFKGNLAWSIGGVVPSNPLEQFDRINYIGGNYRTFIENEEFQRRNSIATKFTERGMYDYRRGVFDKKCPECGSSLSLLSKKCKNESCPSYGMKPIEALERMKNDIIKKGYVECKWF